MVDLVTIHYDCLFYLPYATIPPVSASCLALCLFLVSTLELYSIVSNH